MPPEWESILERWRSADLIDHATAARIREFESAHPDHQGLRWPVLIACALGAILLCAGVLLFVSAHWDELSPAQRMASVVLMVAGFHAAGIAVAGRFKVLSIALHTVGTIALGAGIALAGQIFNLNEHWPNAILLWAIGAALGWALLGHWTQASLFAILAPLWLASEWIVRAPSYSLPAAAGICALSFTYLSALRGSEESHVRLALCALGSIALIPAAGVTALNTWTDVPSSESMWLAWAVALLLPFAAAIALRGRGALWNALAITWTLGLAAFSHGPESRIPMYAWLAVGSVALAAWGIHEARPERVNLGIAGFALTVLAFYFSDVMDKLGRSASLIVLGFLFLGGGWLLERARRRLLAGLHPELI